MLTVHIDDLAMMEGWNANDESARFKFAIPVSAANGATSSQVLYLEGEPSTPGFVTRTRPKRSCWSCKGRSRSSWVTSVTASGPEASHSSLR